MKEKRKIRDKIALKMENPEDMKNFDLQNERELFSLSKIKTKKVSCLISQSKISFNYFFFKSNFLNCKMNCLV